jgi:hypothetical protein
MPRECFYFTLVQRVATFVCRWPQEQLFPAVWSVLSLSFLDVYAFSAVSIKAVRDIRLRNVEIVNKMIT